MTFDKESKSKLLFWGGIGGRSGGGGWARGLSVVGRSEYHRMIINILKGIKVSKLCRPGL